MEQVFKYFTAEKNESILFITAGVIAIAFSIYFFVTIKEPFYNGMSYSLIAFALIQITVGSSVYFRSPTDIQRVNEIIATNKSLILTEEIPRMNTVMKNFIIYRWVEIILIILGIFLFFQTTGRWKGIGSGIVIQGILMLILDFFAESRGKTYLDFLHKL